MRFYEYLEINDDKGTMLKKTNKGRLNTQYKIMDLSCSQYKQQDRSCLYKTPFYLDV
jgi:hypothetical protein